MRVLSYHEWREVMKMSTDRIECPLCSGSGKWEKDCCECGNTAEIDCEVCDEDHLCVPAEVSWDYDMEQEAFGRSAYHNAIKRDMASVYAWTGNMPDVPELYLRNAAPYCDLKTRRLEIRL